MNNRKLSIKLIIMWLMALSVGLFIFVVSNNNRKEVKADEPTVFDSFSFQTFKMENMPENVENHGLTKDLIKSYYNYSESDQLAVITGFLTTPTDLSLDYKMVFPSFALGENSAQVPIVGILGGCGGTADSSGVLATKFNTQNSAFCQKVVEIDIPDSVLYIEEGTFFGFNNLETYKAPFIGLTRGRFDAKNCYTYEIDNTNAFSPSNPNRPYKGTENFNSNHYNIFSAIFGTTDFDYMNHNIKINFDNNTKNNIKNNINENIDYEVEYITQGASENEFLNVPFNNYNINMNFAPKIKNIIITDEISIENRAFSLLPKVENISVKFMDRNAYVPSNTVDTTKYNSPNNYFNNVGEAICSNCYSLKSFSFINYDDKYNFECSNFGNYAFTECYKLTEVHLPIGFTELGESSFYDCIHLEEIKIPSSLKIIGNHAFDSCRRLYTVYTSDDEKAENHLILPSSLERINVGAFRFTAFKEIQVPKSVTVINTYAFQGTTNLETIVLPFIGKTRGNQNTDEALFGYIFGKYENESTSEDKIRDNTICTLQNITGVIGDNNGARNFYIPASLVNVTIQDETWVNSGAFINCSKLKFIEIDSSTSIGTIDTKLTINNNVFAGCTSLESLYLPFAGKTELNWVNKNYRDSITGLNGNDRRHIGAVFGTTPYTDSKNNSGYYLPNKLETISLTHQTYVYTDIFAGVYSVDRIIIGKATQRFERGAFSANYNGQEGLTSLTLPFVGNIRGVYEYHHYVNEFGSWAWATSNQYNFYSSFGFIFKDSPNINSDFYNNFISYLIDGSYDWYSHLSMAYIPMSIKNLTITDDTEFSIYAFRNLRRVESIRITNNVNRFGEGCMANCPRLKEIEVPYLGFNRNYDNLEHTFVKRLDHYWNYYGGSSHDINAYTLGYFFNTSMPNYSVISNTQPTDESLKSENFFYSVVQNGVIYFLPKSLSHVTINSSQYIAKEAFKDMTYLTQVDINSNFVLGTGVFMNDSRLYQLNMENATFTRLPDYTFYKCTNLGNYHRYLPKTVKEIGAHAFEYTVIQYFVESEYGYNFTSIGDYAFAHCQEITSIDFTQFSDSNQFTYLGAHLFEGDKRIVTAKLTNYLSNYMFKDCSSLANVNLTYALSHIILIGNVDYTLSTNLDNLLIPEGIFDGCINLNINRTFEDNLTHQIVGLELDFNSLSIKKIGDYAFRNCKSLEGDGEAQTGFTIPSTVTTIGKAAFKGCTSMTSLLMPRSVVSIPAGSDKNTNARLETGVFWDMDPDFYIITFDDETLWPNGWLYNWNCNVPVHLINDGSPYYYTYEYDSDLQGYVITGLNIYSQQNPNATYIKNTSGKYPFKDVVTLPTRAYGVNVIGVDDFAFQELYDELEDVTGFVIPSSYKYLGADAFHTQKGVGDDALIKFFNLFMGNTLEEAKAKSIKRDIDDELQPRNENPRVPDMLEGYEYFYGNYCVTYYKDIWSMSGGKIKLSAKAIHLNIENEEDGRYFYYNYGKQIKPLILNIQYNKDYIRNFDHLISFDYLDDIFFKKDGEDLILKDNILTVKYSNNIEVSRKNSFQDFEKNKAVISFSVNDNLFTGTAEEYFTIIPIDIFLINDSFVSSENKKELKYVYSGKPYSSKGTSWTVGDNVFGIDNDHASTFAFSGVFETRDINVGDYVATLGYTNDFVWTNGPYVKNNKADVTKNFNIKLNFTVHIEPFKINLNNIEWDDGKTVELDNKLQYSYNGDAIRPKVKLFTEISGSKEYVKNPGISITTHIDNGTSDVDCYIPNIYNNDCTYSVKIVSTDALNILIEGSTYIQKEFVINKGKLQIIVANPTYIIPESVTAYRFSDWDSDSKLEENKISINGLGENSNLTGTLYTFIDENSVISNGEIEGQYQWILDNGNSTYKAYNNKLYCIGFENDYELFNTKFNISEINYYELSVTANVTIAYPDFSFTFAVDSVNIDEDDNEVTKYVYNKSTEEASFFYEADGKAHTVKLVTLNTSNPNVTINDVSVSTFDIYNVDVYNKTFKVSKFKFNPLTVHLQLTVTKGHYRFKDDAHVEYDGNILDLYSFVKKFPADNVNGSLITFDMYRIDGTKRYAIQYVPQDAGVYVFVPKTNVGHSDWFYDLGDYEGADNVEFKVTIDKRKILIDISDPSYGFAVPYKTYDGLPAIFGINSNTAQGLLPGYSVHATVRTSSSDDRIYHGSSNNDFITTSFQVENGLNDNTKNYVLQVVGDFEIKSKVLDYQINNNNNQTVTYTGQSYWPDILVFDYDTNSPLYNARIYYFAKTDDSEEGNPFEEGMTEEEASAIGSLNKFDISKAGTHKLYFMVFNDHYIPKIGEWTINILKADIELEVDSSTTSHVFDDYDHTFKLSTIDPFDAEIYYYVPDGYVDVSSLTFTEEDERLSTTKPSFNTKGIHYIVVVARKENYNDKKILVTYDLSIDGSGFDYQLTADGYVFNNNYEGIQFDTENHGFTLHLPQSDPSKFDGYFYIEDLNNIDEETSLPAILPSEAVIDDYNTWIKFEPTLNDEQTAFEYKFMSDLCDYRLHFYLKRHDYVPQNLTIDFKITKIRLGNIEATGFTGNYDGHYHAPVINELAYYDDTQLDPSLIIADPAAFRNITTFVDSTTDIIVQKGVKYYYQKSSNLLLPLEVKYFVVDQNVTGIGEITVDYEGFTDTLPIFKDVTTAKYVYIRIGGKGIEPQVVRVDMGITKDPVAPSVNVEQPITFEYTASNLTQEELAPYITTIHDGLRLFKYKLINDSNYIDGLPKEPGQYNIILEILDSKNCTGLTIGQGTEITFDLEIIKRVISYDVETLYKEYDGEEVEIVDIELPATTNTTDSFNLIISKQDDQVIKNVGEYDLDISIPAEYTPYYILDSSLGTYKYKVVPRYMRIYVDTTFDYDGINTYSYNTVTPMIEWYGNQVGANFALPTLDGTNGWASLSDEGSNTLLPSDALNINKIYVNSPSKYIYSRHLIYNFDSIQGMYVVSNAILDPIKKVLIEGVEFTNSLGDVVDYYTLDIYFKVSYKYPQLRLDFTPNNLVYNGKLQSAGTLTCLSDTNPLITYWIESEGEFGVPVASGITIAEFNEQLKFMSAGTRRIQIHGYANLYEDFLETYDITIEKATLDSITNDTADKVYDGNPLVPSFDLGFDPDEFIYDVGTDPYSVFYFDIEKYQTLSGYTQLLAQTKILDLISLTNEELEALDTNEAKWFKECKVSAANAVNAGTYLVVIGIIGTPNINNCYAAKVVTISKRALYFLRTPSIVQMLEKEYDKKPGVVSLRYFIYDDPLSNLGSFNALPDAGLVTGHKFEKDVFDSYSFRTSSKNAKLEPYGTNLFEFEFYNIDEDRDSIVITQTGAENYYMNYYPVFVDEAGGSDFFYKINKASLTDLEVYDIDTEFTGESIYPHTNYDGEVSIDESKVIVYEYTDDSFTVPVNNDPVEGIMPRNAGYYIVYVTTLENSNYSSYISSSADLTKFIDSKNYYFKACKVIIRKKIVNPVIDILSKVFDNNPASVSPYFIDVFGNNIPLDYQFMLDGDIIPDAIRAGSYVVSISFAPFSSNVSSISLYSTEQLYLKEISNYEISDTTFIYTIERKIYEINISADELYVNSAWQRALSEGTVPGFIPGFKLNMTIQTMNAAGVYQYTSDFIIRWTITEPDDSSVSYNSTTVDSDSNLIALNYDIGFVFKLNVRLGARNILVEANNTVREYNRSQAKPDIRVLNFRDDEYTITYSVHKLEFLDDLLNDPDYFGIDNNDQIKQLGPLPDPTFDKHTLIDYGVYKVFYQISAGKDIPLVDGFVYVKILKTEGYVSFSDVSRDYNGDQISLGPNNIRGAYNSDDFNNLVLTFYDAQDFEANDTPTPIERPKNVGNYYVRVTNLADNNNDFVQNYTPIDKVIPFEIRRATLNLDIDMDYEVNNTDVINQYDIYVDKEPFASSTNYVNYFGGAQTQTSHTGQVTGTFRISGLVGNELQQVKIQIDKSLLEKKKYDLVFNKQYIELDAEPEVDGNPNLDYYWTTLLKQTNSDEELIDVIKVYWDEIITNNGNTESNKKNYQINISFKLNIHFQSMDVEVFNRSVDYDGTNHDVYFPNTVVGYQELSSVVFNRPTDTNTFTVKFGSSSSDCSLNNMSFSTPGSRRVFFKAVSNPDADIMYEDYAGSFVFTINYLSRDELLKYTDITKTYDNIAITQDVLTDVLPSNEDGLLHIYWDVEKLNLLDMPTESLPSLNQWSIFFYRATKVNGNWVPASERVTAVVDAGEYIASVTIPSVQYYGRTVLNIHFTIERRDVTISTANNEPIHATYNGQGWQYDLVTNNSGLIIQGLCTNHYFDIGVLQTNNKIAGTYTNEVGSSTHIELKPGASISEFDSNHEQILKTVIANYRVDVSNIHTTVIIDKAPLPYEWILNQTSLTYGTLYKDTAGYYMIYNSTPQAARVKLNPIIDTAGSGVDLNASIRPTYSIDNINFQTDPISVTNHGVYTYYLKVEESTNYLGIDTSITVEMRKIANKITVAPDSITKYFDSMPFLNPIISTLDNTEFRRASDSYVINWKDMDGNSIQRPINKGDYKCVIEYPETPNYMGNSIEVDIHILSTPLKARLETIEYEYTSNSIEPKVIFTSSKVSSINFTTYMIQGTSYTVSYYNANDLNTALLTPPKDASAYIMRLDLIGDYANNFDFEVTEADYLQNLNFEVSARPIRISFAGNLSADGGPIILSEQNGDNPGFTVTNLPENYLFGSSLKLKSLEGMEVKDRFIVTGPYQNNPQFDYFTWLTDSVETENPKITDSSLNADLLTNYNITLQIDLIVQGSTIPYSIEKYEGEYDELEHSITFKVLTNVPYQILGYVVNGNTASVLTNLPRYKNFTNGPINIAVKIRCQTYFANEPEQTGFVGIGDPNFTVNILKAHRDINFLATLDLTKTYDDLEIIEPQILGLRDANEQPIKEYYSIDENDNEILMPSSLPKNAGSYVVKARFEESTNYLASNTDAIHYFTINKRKVQITGSDEKDYNGQMYQAQVSSKTGPGINNKFKVSAISGVENTGLITGHILSGIVVTASNNAAKYEFDSDFVWLAGGIKVSKGNTNVTSNYEIMTNIDVTINLGKMEIEFTPYRGMYDGKEHTVSYVWINHPTTTLPDNALIKYYGVTQDVSQASYNPIYASEGYVIVQYIIELANYETIQGYSFIDIEPLNSSMSVQYTNTKLYDGLPYYPDININVTLNDNSDRPYTVTFMDEADNELTAPPVNVGTYKFRVDVAGTGIYIALTQTCIFNISKATVYVTWQADEGTNRMRFDPDNSNNHPTATAIFTRGDSTPYNIELAYSAPLPDSARNVANNYLCSVEMVNSLDVNNFILANATNVYSIYRYAPFDQISFTPKIWKGNGENYVYEEEDLYVEVAFHKGNDSPEYYYVHINLTEDLNGLHHVDEYFDFNWTNTTPDIIPTMDNTYYYYNTFAFELPETWDLQYDPILDEHYIEIKAVLIDKDNMAWDTATYNSDDIVIRVRYDQLFLNYTLNSLTTEIETTDPENSYLFEGSPITVSNLQVWRQNSGNITQFLAPSKDFEVNYLNNDFVNLEASMIVSTKVTSNFTFNDIQKSFAIMSPLPQYLKLKDNPYIEYDKDAESDDVPKAEIFYLKITQEYDYNSVLTDNDKLRFDIITNSDRETIVSNARNTNYEFDTEAVKDIYLVGFMPHLQNFTGMGDPYYNSTKIIDVLKLFDSFNEENKNNFEVLDEDNNQYTEFGEVDENDNVQYSWDSLIKTGILIRLKDQNGNTLDETKLLIFGDSSEETAEGSTYDGIVDVSDFAYSVAMYNEALINRDTSVMETLNYRSTLYSQYIMFIDAINSNPDISYLEFEADNAETTTVLFTDIIIYYNDALASNKVYKYMRLD